MYPSQGGSQHTDSLLGCEADLGVVLNAPACDRPKMYIQGLLPRLYEFGTEPEALY